MYHIISNQKHKIFILTEFRFFLYSRMCLCNSHNYGILHTLLTYYFAIVFEQPYQESLYQVHKQLIGYSTTPKDDKTTKAHTLF